MSEAQCLKMKRFAALCLLPLGEKGCHVQLHLNKLLSPLPMISSRLVSCLEHRVGWCYKVQVLLPRSADTKRLPDSYKGSSCPALLCLCVPLGNTPGFQTPTCWGRGIHRHSLKQHFGWPCFPLHLLSAGTCTHKPHRDSSALKTQRRGLLPGWFLNSCFGYDITAFKLKKILINIFLSWQHIDHFIKKARARCKLAV